MPRYIDADALLLKEETIELPDSNGGEYHIDIIHSYDVERAPTADVVPKSDLDNLEYVLMGVMHSVDKWLDGDELKQDEVNRAATMREKTLQIIEGQTREIERLQRAVRKSLPSGVQACSEEEAMKIGYERGRAAATKELLDEINKRLPAYRHIKSIDIRSGYTWAIVEVRKMLNEIRKERLPDEQ